MGGAPALILERKAQGCAGGVAGPGGSRGHWDGGGRRWQQQTEEQFGRGVPTLWFLASCIFPGGSGVRKAGLGPSLPALGTALTPRLGRSSWPVLIV